MSVAEYLIEGFETLRECGYDLKKVEEFVGRWEGNIVKITEDGRIVLVGIGMMISDEMVINLRYRKVDIRTPEGFTEAANSTGDNLHIFAIRSEKPRYLIRGIRNAISLCKPKTISWFNQDVSKFVLIKGKRNV